MKEINITFSDMTPDDSFLVKALIQDEDFEVALQAVYDMLYEIEEESFFEYISLECCPDGSRINLNVGSENNSAAYYYLYENVKTIKNLAVSIH